MLAEVFVASGESCVKLGFLSVSLEHSIRGCMPVLHNLYLPCDCMTVQEPVDLLRLAHCIVCRLCRPVDLAGKGRISLGCSVLFVPLAPVLAGEGGY